jgi:hypothetical protein
MTEQDQRDELMYLNPYGGDWLAVDTAYLPTSQLPLLRSMLARRLINIQRSIHGTPEREMIKPKNFFRKGHGITILELEDLAPVYFSYLKYNRDEISLDVSLEPPGFGLEELGLAHRYTLYDQEYVDDRLYHLVGQRILKMRILIRKPDLPRDKAQALQDGIEMTFDSGTTIIISYYLNELQNSLLQILYPEEIPWYAVEYSVDVARGRIPWRYRFNWWKWRALDRLGRRFGLE